MLEKNKSNEPKIATPAEGEEGAEATTTPAEATKEDKPSTN